uniref:Putative ovule protein n=1 Tax=Solanum chacoense TaxID=4108 RepID=A0A0V0GS46_SOLCH
MAIIKLNISFATKKVIFVGNLIKFNDNERTLEVQIITFSNRFSSNYNWHYTMAMLNYVNLMTVTLNQ